MDSKICRFYDIGREEDPVGEGGRGAARDGRSARNRMYQCGMQLYPGARHELFHEINGKSVFGDIVDW